MTPATEQMLISLAVRHLTGRVLVVEITAATVEDSRRQEGSMDSLAVAVSRSDLPEYGHLETMANSIFRRGPHWKTPEKSHHSKIRKLYKIYYDV